MQCFHYEFQEMNGMIANINLSLNVLACSPAIDSTLIHTNNCYELHIITEGSAIIKLDEISTEIHAGEMYLTTPHTPHGFIKSLSESSQAYVINFFVKENSNNSPISNWLLKCKEMGAIILKNDFNAEKYIDQIHTECITKKSGYIEKGLALLFCLLTDIMRCASSPATLPIISNPNHNRMRVIDQYLNQHLSNCNADELAKQLFLSERQLSRIIKNIYGKSLREVNIEKRIIHAKHLLANTNLTIEQIAEMSGFSTQKYFSNTFKGQTGLTPTKYRKEATIT